MDDHAALIRAALNLYECLGEQTITTELVAAQALTDLFEALRGLAPDAAHDAFMRGFEKARRALLDDV